MFGRHGAIFVYILHGEKGKIWWLIRAIYCSMLQRNANAGVALINNFFPLPIFAQKAGTGWNKSVYYEWNELSIVLFLLVYFLFLTEIYKDSISYCNRQAVQYQQKKFCTIIIYPQPTQYCRYILSAVFFYTYINIYKDVIDSTNFFIFCTLGTFILLYTLIMSGAQKLLS